jgi:nucleoside-diphosphate-sugar epimerase
LHGTENTALILGASGLFGSHAARAFATAGWTVRRYRRGTDMAAAATGAQVIVNAMNPPHYHDWARLIPKITAEVLAAARASGATVIVPGNVYVFGDQPGPWGVETPHRPVSRKGRIRAEMEAAYAAAARNGIRTILLRGGDFLAAESPSTLMNMVVLKSLAKGRITALGRPGAQHAYAYLPDMARAAVALAEERERLPAYADVPFPGLTFRIDDLKAEIERQAGRPLRLKQFNWTLLRLLSPFWELAREFREMRYLFDTPHSLAAQPFAALLPGFRMTPFADVVAAHLAQLQGSVTSTQTSRWRDADSAVARSGSSGSGQITPDPASRNAAEGRT